MRTRAMPFIMSIGVMLAATSVRAQEPRPAELTRIDRRFNELMEKALQE